MNLAPTLESITSITTDFLSLIIIVAIFFMYGWFKGKDYVASLSISLIIASVLYSFFPYTKNILENVSTSAELIARVAIFGILTFAIHIVLNRTLLLHSSYKSIRNLTELLILSIIAAGVLVVVLYKVMPFSKIYVLNPEILAFFSSPTTIFFTLLAPFVALYFINRG